MRYLILTDAFLPPLFGVRMRNLACNLVAHGHEVHIATEQATNEPYQIDGCKMHFFRYYKGGRLTRMLQRAADKLFLRKETIFFRFLKQEFHEQHFDYIIASAYLFPLRSPRLFANLTTTPLLLDLRDIVEQWGNDRYLTKDAHTAIGRFLAMRYIKKITSERNKTMRAAYKVTTVSEGLREILYLISDNVSVIYNGYDPKTFFAKDIPTDEFSIVYTGSIRSAEVRDPSLLMEGLRELHLPIFVDWYTEGKGREIIKKMATEYGVEQYMRYHNYIPSSEVPDLLHHSSIVLVLGASNRTGEQATKSVGILTTKLFEAIGVEKPVLCIPSDEGEMEQVITKSRAGIAAREVDDVVTFIREQYAAWSKNGFTHQKIDKEYCQRFSREEQAIQFENSLLHPSSLPHTYDLRQRKRNTSLPHTYDLRPTTYDPPAGD